MPNNTLSWVPSVPQPVFENGQITIPCSGTGLDHGINGSPCDCVMHADMTITSVLTDQFTADQMARYNNWTLLKVRTVHNDELRTEGPLQYTMFCSGHCALSWMRATRHLAPDATYSAILPTRQPEATK